MMLDAHDGPDRLAAPFKHGNREAWLAAGADVLCSWLLAAGYPVHAKYRCACGFPSKGATGARSRTLGQAWDPDVSAGQVAEVLISPVLAVPVDVLAVLIHELIHVATPKAGHKGPFRKAAAAVGLTGKMTATVAGPELASRLNTLAVELGPYPHDALTPATRGSKGSRLLLVTCGCGIKARMSQKAGEEAMDAGWLCRTCGESIGIEGGSEDEPEPEDE